VGRLPRLPQTPLPSAIFRRGDPPAIHRPEGKIEQTFFVDNDTELIFRLHRLQGLPTADRGQKTGSALLGGTLFCQPRPTCVLH
jgi:hypothetical protein